MLSKRNFTVMTSVKNDKTLVQAIAIGVQNYYSRGKRLNSIPLKQKAGEMFVLFYLLVD
jgi:hypothetical protein